MLRLHKDQAPILRELSENKDMLRVSGYANSKEVCSCLLKKSETLITIADAFKEFAPKLYKFYEAEMKKLMDSDNSLATPFSGSVFASTAFNFGPRVVTTPHRDHLNLAYGWCSITALGRFDHTAGGHLVLPDLKLAIEFPAGSTVLIPSAALTHHNLPIGFHETRQSVTQYSAGGIFRWISYGFQLKKVAEAASVTGKIWWKQGEGLYTKWPVVSTKRNQFKSGDKEGSVERKEPAPTKMPERRSNTC